MYTLYIYTHTHTHTHKTCSRKATKGLRKNIKKKKRRDGNIGEHELNEMGPLNMKQKK